MPPSPHPHPHPIQAATPEFKAYVRQVRANAVAVSAALVAHGYTIATGGTDNHLVLWDLRPQGITGAKFEKVCDAVSITLNKNSVYGDKSAISPGGARIGTPALTTRGFKEADFGRTADFLHRAVQIAALVQAEGGKTLKEFEPLLKGRADIAALRDEVQAFARSFPMPGRTEEGSL